MMATATGLRAQEVTIQLLPGWTWIAYPYQESADLEVIFEGFEPQTGDVIESMFSMSEYSEDDGWFGGIDSMEPGMGYLYFSTRTEAIDVVLHSPIPQFTVTTATPTDITTTSAVVGGTVTAPEGGHVFLRGVCWGTEPNPDIDGSHTNEETGVDLFTTTLDSLTLGTTYYVRAYAVTDFGLAYGENLSFTTLGGTPTGAINCKFTINADGEQVFFSQGNLQYIGSAAEPYWKFADNQWDCLDTMTGQNSTDLNVDRDLFGWGTSGWDCGNTCYHPWDTFNSAGSSYGPAGANNLSGAYANADWGIYNSISNGGDQPNQWRTLTTNEWEYVFDTRTTSSGIRYAKANVNNVNGVILLPDDWNTAYYELNDTNTGNTGYSSNSITFSDWSILEEHGAVFLPATGYRFGTSVRNVGSRGNYWSTSYVNGTYACGVYFYDSNLNSHDCCNRTYGRGVRLVQVAE